MLSYTQKMQRTKIRQENPKLLLCLGGWIQVVILSVRRREFFGEIGNRSFWTLTKRKEVQTSVLYNSQAHVLSWFTVVSVVTLQFFVQYFTDAVPKVQKNFCLFS